MKPLPASIHDAAELEVLFQGILQGCTRFPSGKQPREFSPRCQWVFKSSQRPCVVFQVSDWADRVHRGGNGLSPWAILGRDEDRPSLRALADQDGQGGSPLRV